MAATQQDFTLYAGDTVAIPLTVYDSSGALLNITGSTILWGLFAAGEQAPVVSKTNGSGIVLTTPASGLATISISAADTVGLAPGKYYHEAELTDASGNVTTITTGTVTLRASRL